MLRHLWFSAACLLGWRCSVQTAQTQGRVIQVKMRLSEQVVHAHCMVSYPNGCICKYLTAHASNKRACALPIDKTGYRNKDLSTVQE